MLLTQDTLEHPADQRFAGTLRFGRENQCRLGIFADVLHHPGEVPHQVAELLAVTLADHTETMPEERPCQKKTRRRVGSETTEQIMLAGLLGPRLLEHQA